MCNVLKIKIDHARKFFRLSSDDRRLPTIFMHELSRKHGINGIVIAVAA